MENYIFGPPSKVVEPSSRAWRIGSVIGAIAAALLATYLVVTASDENIVGGADVVPGAKFAFVIVGAILVLGTLLAGFAPRKSHPVEGAVFYE